MIFTSCYTKKNISLECEIHNFLIYSSLSKVKVALHCYKVKPCFVLLISHHFITLLCPPLLPSSLLILQGLTASGPHMCSLKSSYPNLNKPTPPATYYLFFLIPFLPTFWKRNIKLLPFLICSLLYSCSLASALTMLTKVSSIFIIVHPKASCW